MDRQGSDNAIEESRAVGIAIGFCAGLIVGVCAGAGLALAYAPKSGNEMRNQLRESGLQVKGRVQDTLEWTKQRVQRHADAPDDHSAGAVADIAAGVVAQDGAQAADVAAIG
jgi:gas vesicle protein